ncbi:MAG: serpin family protein [Gemmatimonadota bacterium]|nr:serpin family protein [Gemmatimonadota bacterium]MDH3422015.1 serpin family protein [Gemmatimonadota bacterium]
MSVRLPSRLPLRCVLLAALLGVPACSDASAPSPGPITQLPRDLSAVERSVISASNAFGLDLMGRVSGEDPRLNVVLSPISASMALGMTLNGASSTTFDAMRSALGFGSLTQDQINDSYRELIDLLTDLDPAVRFDIANAIWANENVPFHAAFFEAVSAAFDARAESRDFGDPATVVAINDWVQENTGGLIDSIVDSLDPSLVMLLVNAIYLDAAWTVQFDPEDTYGAVFAREDGSSVPVDMMSRSDAQVPFASTSEYVAVELPYGGAAFSMVIVVPTLGVTVRNFLLGLDAPAWQALVSGLAERELGQVGLPKFTLTYDGFLNDALKAMGMEVAFAPGADFTRMSPIGDELCISFVRQKTFIEVDERGTRAAAVTGVGVGVTSAPPSFVADRPFFFAIRERLSGTLLFTGVVGDPTAEDPGPETFTTDCG